MSEKRESYSQTFKSFSSTFWVGNFLQLTERWAYFSIFSLLALYLVAGTDEGGLGLTHTQKGNIMAQITAILFLLPLFFGVIADRIGYKLSLLISCVIMGVGYYLMGMATSYWDTYFAFLLAAIGCSFFRPVVQGIIARHTDEGNGTLGFGLFYMVGNIGGLLGPGVSSYLRTTMGWKVIFIQATVIILFNLLVILFLYKEPKTERQYNIPLLAEIKGSVRNIIEALKDKKLTILLFLMVGFWTVYNQLFYTLPNFIEDWVDSSRQSDWINRNIPLFGSTFTENGQIKAEWFGNIDCVMIIMTQMIISYFVMKMDQVSAMIRGTIIMTIGVTLTFMFNQVIFTVLGTTLFAIGEIAVGPTISAFIAKITPKGKEALYQGTYFLPMALGSYLTGFFTGNMYDKWSDKHYLLQLEMKQRAIDMPEGLSKKQFFEQAQEKLQMSPTEITNLLWNTYHPNKYWYIIFSLGLLTAISIYLFNRYLKKLAH
ncbi:MFS transporter [Capnocytophaga sp. G2]|uniref:MFS transporter n=1 Tax=Capnocytophaga sp. G2 TaxID=3110695 RepID=UPI002B4A78F2|nr:MFS transporter [Capnocytophaga sp. G2]MEB3004515.1 MFS transporter [Capnocytophaga sp. G2]